MKPTRVVALLAVVLFCLLPGVRAGDSQPPPSPVAPAGVTSPAPSVDSATEVASGAVTQGALRLTRDGKTLELPLRHTSVAARVSGYIARVTVTQQFANPYDRPIEAVYVFPLPENAAVDAMTMRIGTRVIRGVIKKRDEARQIYEQAKAAGKTASLLEQERPNIFTQSVANILPGDDIRIEISYVQALRYDHGSYEFTFPMVVGPRFIPGTPTGTSGGGWSEDTDQVPDASRITPPVIKPEYRSGTDITLTLDVDAGVPIQNISCPSHQVTVRRPGPTQVQAEIRPGDRIPNKDFIFRYDVAGKAPAFALLTTGRPGTGYFMLMLQPQASFRAEELTPREMVFVVDCSGSMSGFPVEKAKEAVKLALAEMAPRDYFQIIKFSLEAGGFAPAPVPNTPANVERARAFVDSMSGEGGTMMIEGIKAALDYPHDPSRRRIVLFMTDGYIGNEKEILAAIEQKLGNTRLFSFGVGSSVNRYLLEKMAQVGRGAVTYCRPDEDPTAQVKAFAERIAKPFLMDIDVDWQGLAVTDVLPARIPDLFASQPVVIFGRYTRPGAATVRVEGTVAGKPWSQNIPVVLPADQPAHDVLGTLWARTRIEQLMDEMFEGPDSALVGQVTELALAHSLTSAYTSFVAVEEQVRNVGGKLETVQVPVPIPEGVSYEGVFGEAENVGGSGGPTGRRYAAQAAPPTSLSRGTRGPVPADARSITATSAPRSVIAFERLSILGALESSAVLDSLDAHRDALARIADRYRARAPKLAGALTVWIAVNADGTVKTVTIKTSTLARPALERALVRELRRVRFAAPTDRGTATVNVTLVLRP